ncbi:MAG: PQQ-dependent sugar dehydrogenase [Chloroflexia bacterium]
MRFRFPRRLLAPAVLILLATAAILLWKTIFGGLLGVNVDTALAGQANLTLPPGFRSNIFASGLAGPRFMAVSPDGTLFVAERGLNRIVALPNANHDGRADGLIVVAADLHAPSSLDFAKDGLLVGEQDQVTELTLDSSLHATARRVLIPNLPDTGVHTTKTVLVGPDGKIYLAIGSSCNVCKEDDPRRAAVWVYAADGTGGRVLSKGLRNAVGLAVNPVTHAVWATNNGRDMLGDDQPPETVNILRDGADFGWPRCHAGTLPDPDFAGALGCSGVAQPAVTMHAHMAPLGLAFYQGSVFPAGYRDSLYVAFHGSWNSTHLVGYKVMRVPLSNSQVSGPAEDFATGWQTGDLGAVGRPVGIVAAADGSLLVSDDKSGLIYRISYAGK